jgi:hypothetical protein
MARKMSTLQQMKEWAESLQQASPEKEEGEPAEPALLEKKRPAAVHEKPAEVTKKPKPASSSVKTRAESLSAAKAKGKQGKPKGQ